MRQQFATDNPAVQHRPQEPWNQTQDQATGSHYVQTEPTRHLPTPFAAWAFIGPSMCAMSQPPPILQYSTFEVTVNDKSFKPILPQHNVNFFFLISRVVVWPTTLQGGALSTRCRCERFCQHTGCRGCREVSWKSIQCNLRISRGLALGDIKS